MLYSFLPVTRTHHSADVMRKLLALRSACTNAAPDSDVPSASCGRQNENVPTVFQEVGCVNDWPVIYEMQLLKFTKGVSSQAQALAPGGAAMQTPAVSGSAQGGRK